MLFQTSQSPSHRPHGLSQVSDLALLCHYAAPRVSPDPRVSCLRGRRKARKNSGGGKRCGATPPGNTCCKRPPHHCSPWSPRKVPSHLGSGGEGISLTSLLKVFWPSIRSPLPLPEFLSSAMSGDLSSLNGVVEFRDTRPPHGPFWATKLLGSFPRSRNNLLFQKILPSLEISPLEGAMFAALTHVPPSSSCPNLEGSQPLI